MPDTAFVAAPGMCPVCGAHAIHGVRCQWGTLPGPSYQLGDEVQWLRDDQGRVVPPCMLIGQPDGRRRWNCGSPDYRNVMLFDVLFAADVYARDATCPQCNTPIAATLALVRDGRLAEVRVLTNNQLDDLVGALRGKVDIIVIRDDGTPWLRDDWYDHPITFVGR